MIALESDSPHWNTCRSLKYESFKIIGIASFYILIYTVINNDIQRGLVKCYIRIKIIKCSHSNNIILNSLYNFKTDNNKRMLCATRKRKQNANISRNSIKLRKFYLNSTILNQICKYPHCVHS